MTKNDFASGVVDKLECIPDEFNTVKICASVGKTKNEQTPVDLNATIGDVVSVLGNFIDFNVTRTDEGTGPSAANQHEKKSCFSVLMMASADKTNMPEKREEKTSREKLKNALIDWLVSSGVGWSLQEKEFLGMQIINTLSSALWDIDGNHSTLSQRGCGIPDAFGKFAGFNQPELHKKRKIDAAALQEGNNNLFLLGSPRMTS